MDNIPIISLILYSFPESMIYISLGLALYGYSIKDKIKRIIVFGIVMTIISYFIRALPYSFLAIIGILLLTFVCLTIMIFQLNLIRAIFVVVTSYIILFVAESTIAPLITKSLGLTFEQVIKNPVLRITIPWVHLLLLVLVTVFLRRKKTSLLPSLNLLEVRTPSGKMIFWLIGLILFQAMLGLTTYSAFTNWSTKGGLFETAWVRQLFGYLLIFLPVISIYMIRKLFNLVERENVIASQEAFIDNINNLFSTIRAQRHDFMNHVQILDSYLKMNKIDEAKYYMADIMEETKEINEIMVVNNPFLNALIQAKMGVAQRYKIHFELDIHTALADLTVKPFDLVKILGNLINNAMEAVKDLDQDCRRIKLSVNKQENTYVIEVFNRYPVIPPDIRKKIFQGGFTTKKGSEHYGIGLSVVKKLTEKYNGTLALHSSKEDGTTFTVTLPAI